MLRELIRTENVKNAIIFCNRKRDVAILLKSLQKHGFNAGALHGDMDQSSRTATLDGFREGRISLLAASDVAARGLDIPDVSHIFNFDVPWQSDDYVHRIGRTGRAGKEGRSLTLVTPGGRQAAQGYREDAGRADHLDRRRAWRRRSLVGQAPARARRWTRCVRRARPAAARDAAAGSAATARRSGPIATANRVRTASGMPSRCGPSAAKASRPSRRAISRASIAEPRHERSAPARRGAGRAAGHRSRDRRMARHVRTASAPEQQRGHSEPREAVAPAAATARAQAQRRARQ